MKAWTQPGYYGMCATIDVHHYLDLMAPFANVILVDTDGVDPDRLRLCWVSEVMQRMLEVGTYLEVFFMINFDERAKFGAFLRSLRSCGGHCLVPYEELARVQTIGTRWNK